MSNPVISVRGLGKKYRLGATIKHDMLRDQIAGAFKFILHRNSNPSSDKGQWTKDQGHDSLDHGHGSSDQGFRTKESEPVPIDQEQGTTDNGPGANSSEFWALRDVSFDVQQGEVIGVIGRNGAGKSTLLKILSEITEPTTGEIHIRGRVGSLLEVGTGFHPELSGRENIFLNGAILGMTRAEIKARFDEIVDFAEIEKFLYTPVKRYSSGMYVRLAFAVAAHFNPEILFIDEVLAVGDFLFQNKCLNKMDEVSKSGRTIIFVSHNTDAILNICSSIFIIEKGRVGQKLPPEEGVNCYLKNDTNFSSIKHSEFQYSKSLQIIQGLKIYDDEGRKDLVRLGQGIHFDILIGNLKDFYNVQCALVITNNLNQRVVQFHSRYHSNLIIPSLDRINLSCYAPTFQLIPGTYYVDVLVGNEHKLFEKIEHAGKFDVIYNDFPGYGHIPPKEPGVVILLCEWELRSSLLS